MQELPGQAAHGMIGRRSTQARPPGALMSIVRRDDRPVLARGPQRPTLQRLVDRASGTGAVTILINVFAGDQAVPEHTHQVEEVLLVTAGECTITVDGREEAAREGDAVIILAGS